MYERNLNKDIISLLNKKISKYLCFKNNNINDVYQKCLSRFTNNLKSNYLISISRVQYNHLICVQGIKHVSIMESWDHPVKSPYWHKPNYVLTWNKDLKSDYYRYQNFKDVKFKYIRPIKFRYIFERKEKCPNHLIKTLSNKEYLRDINIIRKNKTIVYATTTSSLNPEYHEGEVELIKKLCEAFCNTDKLLYIKPKPNGPKGDYDNLKRKYSNVVIGSYSMSPNSADMLNEEYHTFRYLLLYYTNLIINFGTTFVLESSLMNVPILQLQLSENKFGKFGQYANNIHIKKYLLRKEYFKLKNTVNINQTVNGEFAQMKTYSRALKKWLVEQ